MSRPRILTYAFLAIFLTFSALAQKPSDLIPNRVKYRDSGIPVATGRSGSAAIAARALLSRDGSTDLELTTGDFDGRAAIGTISGVQLKIGTATRNYNNLQNSGALSLRLGDTLGRHAPLQVQSLVRGIDGARTDVVTVNEIVKLRPDVVAAALDAPARAFLGAPLTITAIAAERNGDSGARANCVLSVDGVEVDRANSIWIDAGDSVTCRFEHTFTAAGDKLVEARLDDVAPGDWNDANNRLTQTVSVVAPSAMPEFRAFAIEESYERYQKFDTPFEHSETRQNVFHTGTNFRGYLKQTAVDFDSLSLAYDEVSDGTVFVHAPAMELLYEFERAWQRCKDFAGDGARFTVCSPALPKDFPYDDQPTDLISVEGSRNSNAITYLSSGTSLSRGYPEPEGEWYSWNRDYTQLEGKQLHYGSSVDMTVRVSDGTNAVEARPNVVLIPYERHYDNPYTCVAGGSFCRAESDHTVGKTGLLELNW
ncbi:MAG TPA: hypothetical protein VF846_12470 [Thermoanaerobaculia bacterium]|jgi:hypothetical protein